MSSGARILVVEDEPVIRRGICDLLAYHGHRPTPVADGISGAKEALSGVYELLVLDVMLPGRDGFSICREVREAIPRQAVLILTAKGRESDVLEGFQAGCDDYVSKPFSVAQFMARVDALLRRVDGDQPRQLDFGRLRVDADNLTALFGSAEVALSKRDVEVLSYLFRERHRIVSREDLLRDVWGYARIDAVETRCIDMHIVKLRRKLTALPVDAHALIETVRGAGYRLRPESC